MNDNCYWITSDAQIKPISEDKYFEWRYLKTNNHRLLRVTKKYIEYSHRGICLNINKTLLKNMLELYEE